MTSYPLSKRVAANWTISKTWNTGWSRLWVVCRTCWLVAVVCQGPLACFAPLLSVLMTKAASWQQDLLHSLSARTGTANVKWFNKVFQICRFGNIKVFQSIAMTFPTGWKDVLHQYLQRSTLAVFAAAFFFASCRSFAFPFKSITRFTTYLERRCFKLAV